MRWASGFAIAVVVGLAACGGDSTAPPSQGGVTGTYTLRTVNGNALPFTVQQNLTSKTELVDDEYTLNADHSYSEVGHYRVTSGATSITQLGQDQGIYTYSGGALSLRSSVGSVTGAGSISGSQLTIIDQGVTFVYSK